MCDQVDGNVRTFQAGLGKLTQCLKCNMLGFQIGTAYFAVHPQEMPGLSEWILEVRQREGLRLEGRKKLYLQIHSSRVMLALSAQDIEDLWSLFQQGWQWTGTLAVPHPMPTLSGAIH